MKFKLSCCALLAVGLLSACSYESKEGNSRLTPAKAASIQKGITSKAQVRALIGEPQSIKTQVPVVQPAGTVDLPAKLTASEILAFWYKTERKPFVALPRISEKPRESSYTVIIFFDSSGTVLDCQVEDLHS